MKILHINTSDIQGGAARAAYRLHRALLDENVDSQMLVQYKASDDYTVKRLDFRWQKIRAKFAPALDALPLKRYPDRTKTLFSPASIPFSGIRGTIVELNPDIVHLHWVCGGMMSIEDIARIKQPIVWSLHDDWAFTGGCHIKWECKNYKKQCGNCPRLGSNSSKDLSHSTWKRKHKTFNKIENLTVVGLSHWLTDCAKESSLLQSRPIINLPNLLDTKIFKTFDKKLARELLRLPLDKKLIAFGANSATSDINKGFKELSQALQLLPAEYELVVFGSSQPKEPQNFKQQVHYLGHLHDDVSLRPLYSASDVMVVPSLQENLSNAIMESLACGTPVVAFAIGGNSDMIDHRTNGYLAQSFSPEDLAKGIQWVLNTEQYEQLCKNARYKILNYFDKKIVVSRYINMYDNTLST